MLCAQFLLRKRQAVPEEVRPLPCRSWTCELCAPQRRRMLMAEAASGEPNKLLTITVNTAVAESAAERRDLLHGAWKSLVKRINRQFQLPPARRWALRSGARSAKREHVVRAITARTLQLEVKTVPYFAFLERTKRGEPHLHILLRVPFIPQDWLSEQMADLAGSPVLWIEAIKGTKHAVAYVTKYITKAPAQWGNKKRYWQSRNWKVNPGTPEKPLFERCDDVEVVRVRWPDYIRERNQQRYTVEVTPDGWFRIWKPGAHHAWADRVPGVLYRSEEESKSPAAHA